MGMYLWFDFPVICVIIVLSNKTNRINGDTMKNIKDIKFDLNGNDKIEIFKEGELTIDEISAQESFIYGDCMSFAKILTNHFGHNENYGAVAYIERWLTPEGKEFEENFNGNTNSQAWQDHLNNKAHFDVDTFSVCHVGYLLPSGQVIDGQYIFSDTKEFERHILRNYDVLYEESYFEENPTIVAQTYPFINDKDEDVYVEDNEFAYANKVIEALEK